MGRVRSLGALVIVAVAGCTGAGAVLSGADRVGAIPDPDVEIFMRVKATPAQIAVVRKVVQRSSSVRTYAFLTHSDALREFRRIYRDQPDVLARATEANLPTSFRVMLVEGKKPSLLKRALAGTAGIDEIKQRDHQGELSPAVADRPKILDSVSADQLPTSFRVKLRAGVAAGPIARAWTELDGVEDVTERPFRRDCAALAQRGSGDRVDATSSMQRFERSPGDGDAEHHERAVQDR
jgi:cell division protein FtsX